MGSYKLRVHSDLARRYWIVYRFGSQSFANQEPDTEESEKAEQQLANTDLYMDRPIQLYKRLCVTVSWSRHLAVAAFFGPPPKEMMKEKSMQVSDHEGKALDHPGESLNGTDRVTSTFHVDEIDQERDRHRNDQGSATETATLNNVLSHDSNATKCSSQRENTVDKLSSKFSISASSKSVLDATSNVQHWLQKHSQSFREKSRKVLHSTVTSRQPMEGVLDLDNHLILCEEIYTRLIGNHQTSRVSKEQVLSLDQQDIAEHLKSNSKKTIEDEASVSPLIMAQGRLMQPGGVNAQSTVMDDDSKAAAIVDERKGTLIDEVSSNKEEPLVAYWKWEHSFHTQQMKMHLAKNSDLALHVVIAIIANQVRYERNAIAMSM
ncbi:hypothetical protein FisN_4Lh579 [Fistulifera solaris]|uniref:Uncharacterized protein n=1 Tax=Fistulifera solaris TaxID=1519565 RepID=A0A1Z5KDV7_FISSO|nr:hypothetical protein FisN_4Lh579 [Fistulifera solaris]|eukprot:GAX24439.1 hypothetical protein FisN_4Lh579 [Fistulifera solaris]